MDYDIDQDFSITRKESIKAWALFHQRRGRELLETDEEFSELIRQIKHIASIIYKEEVLFEINNWNYQGLPLLDNCVLALYCQCTDSEKLKMNTNFGIFANDFIIDFQRYKNFTYDEEEEDLISKFCVNPVSGRSSNILKDYRFSMNVTKPKDIRNYTTLVETFKFLVQTFDRYGNKILHFIDNQLRSLEKDMYFQDINNFLLLDVYEFHLQILILLKNWVLFERLLVSGLLGKYYLISQNTHALSTKKSDSLMKVLSLWILWNLANREWSLISEFLKHFKTLAPREYPDINYVITLVQYYSEGNYHFFLKKFYKNQQKYTLYNTVIEQFLLNHVKMGALEDLTSSYGINKSALINDFKLLSKHLYFKDIHEYTEFCRTNLLFERYCWGS